MSVKRITNKKDGRSGWLYRAVDPLTGNRVRKRVWISEKREADRALKKWQDRREAERMGLPTAVGWQLPYDELVARFVAEAPITSLRRRELLKSILLKNHLRIRAGADLAHLGTLTSRCLNLVTQGEFSEHYAVFSVQKTLKQLSRWAASVSLLPYDPLGAWRRLPWSGQQRHRRAFQPEELRAVLAAAEEYDQLLNRTLPSGIIYKALLLTGNRPGAVLNATVGDLQEGRIILPRGTKQKRNGMATVPEAFVAELKAYLTKRGELEVDAPLFASYQGSKGDRANLRHDFKKAMVLAFVQMHWPAAEPTAREVDPVNVAHAIYTGRLRGFDGPRPKDPEKLKARARKIRDVEALVKHLKPRVERQIEGLDMYCLRKTHISWARRLVSPDSVRIQVGHAARDVEERHYLDLVDPSESSQAVWDILTGEKNLRNRRHRGEKLQDGGPDVATFA